MKLPKAGDTIELLSMENDPDPIEVGSKGTVESVVPWGNGEYQIHMQWESGRRLHLIYPHDKIRIIKSQED